jgi:uncharacterized protein
LNYSGEPRENNGMTLNIKFLNTILDHVKIGLVVIDKNNEILVFNKLAGEMLGENPTERLGTDLLLCHPPESEKGVLKLIEDIIHKRIDHYEGWSNYQGRMLYEYIIPLWDDDGKYIGMIEELHEAK